MKNLSIQLMTAAIIAGLSSPSFAENNNEVPSQENRTQPNPPENMKSTSNVANPKTILYEGPETCVVINDAQKACAQTKIIREFTLTSNQRTELRDGSSEVIDVNNAALFLKPETYTETIIQTCSNDHLLTTCTANVQRKKIDINSLQIK